MERRPVYQNKRPKDSKPSRLAGTPGHKPFTITTRYESIAIHLPGAHDLPTRNGFTIERETFLEKNKGVVRTVSGTSLTPIDRQPAKRNGNHSS